MKLKYAITAAALWVSQAQAFTTTNECLDPAPNMEAYCMGVAMGALELMSVENRVCAPPGVTYAQAIAMARKVARKYPELWNQPWVSAVGATALDWPCKRQPGAANSGSIY